MMVFLQSDSYFDSILARKEKAACKSYKTLTKKFLRNVRSENYVQIVNNLLSAFKEQGCQMSL